MKAHIDYSKYDTPAQAQVRAILEAEQKEQQTAKAAVEAPAQHRINALEARLARVEAALQSNVTWKALPEFLVEVFVEFTAVKIKSLVDRIVKLEARPDSSLKYLGVYRQDATYSEGSLVTRDGSIFHANKTTREAPGDGCMDWTLAVKRGRDGRDGKNA
jgi:hypothetical protein